MMQFASLTALFYKNCKIQRDRRQERLSTAPTILLLDSKESMAHFENSVGCVKEVPFFP
jgi:hypothetical protein